MRIILIYIGILLTTFAFLFSIKSFDISYPLQITNTTKSSELAVVGEGKVDVVPDSASVSVGITVNNAKTVEAAQKTIDETNNKIIDAMKNLGIDKKDITTSNYSINPNYSYEGGKNSISGYNGNVNLTIKVKDNDLLSKVIDEATKSGANQVFGTTFTIENPDTYREQARNKAIQNAKDQAEKLAKTLGIRLGKITNIVETSPNYPVPFLKIAADGRGGSASPEIEQGTQTVSSTVTLYFEKK